MRSKLRRPIFVFALVAGLGALVTYGVYRSELARAQSELDRELTSIGAQITRTLGAEMAYLTATRAFLANRDDGLLSRDDFALYVSDLGLGEPEAGLQGVGFAQIVSPEEEREINERLARDYGLTKGIWPESRLDMRSSIVLLEPYGPSNSAAVGYDMLTDPIRRQVMIAAMAEPDSVIMSPPVVLLQEAETSRQAGILIYSYFPGRGAGSPAGFIYLPIRVGEFFAETMRAQNSSLILDVRDKTAPEQPLYITPQAPKSHPDRLKSRLELTVAGRKWVLSGQSGEDHSLLTRYPYTFASGLILGILALMTAVAFQGFSAAIRQARGLNEVQARLMREKDLHLREMSHRLKNSLARVAAMGRQAARGAQSKEEFVNSMTSRLQAMANAQDVLTRSAAGRAGLKQLLSSELGQIMGEEGARAALSGPEVQLNPNETQALGLTFHELATNSLKYGAGADPEALLDIHWRIETPAGKPKELHLTWDEKTGKATQEPEHKGFGSQLLDSCIRHELGGKIERDYHAQGLTVRFSFPLSETKPA